MKNLKSILYFLLFVIGTSGVMGCTSNSNYADEEYNKSLSDRLDDNRTEKRKKSMPYFKKDHK